MSVILWLMQSFLGPYFGASPARYVALAVLVASGILSYFAIGSAIGAFRLSEFRRATRRG